MKAVILDTHAFIFFINGDKKLPSTSKGIILDPEITIHLSIASLWEIAIKNSLKKLELAGDFNRIPEFLLENSILQKNILFKDLQELRNLPFHHRDPFDRLIIAQAKAENLTVITKDSEFQEYDIPVVWN